MRTFSVQVFEEWMHRRYPQMEDQRDGAIGVAGLVHDNSTLQRYWRARRLGHISSLVADRLAVGFGVHPSEIWPDWDEVDEDEANAVRMPNAGTAYMPHRRRAS